MGMRAVAATLLGISACGSTPAPVSVSMSLSLDETCTSFWCSEPRGCPLDCGGEIGVFALDAQGAVLSSECIPFDLAEDGTLFDLEGLLDGVSFTFVQGTVVTVEVAVYPVADPTGCKPSSDPGMTQFPMYVGRSEPATLAGDVSIRIPVGCTAPATCTSALPGITSQVIDLATLASPDYTEAVSLDVRAGYVFWEVDDVPFAARFNPTVGLSLVPENISPSPSWATDVGDQFVRSDLCPGTIVTRVGAGPAVSTASCELVFDNGVDASIQSYHLAKSDLDQVLAALSLTEFPAGGLLVGRLISQSGGTPSAIVRPITPAGTATMTYLERSAETGQLVAASSGSWFVATAASLAADGSPEKSASCCDTFEAVDVSTGEPLGQSPARVGVVRGVVTATLISVP
jgi:hypothetical protein